MIELQRRAQEPDELRDFRAQNPGAGPKTFDNSIFTPTKQAVKRALNEDQGGLCVYCETKITANQGHVEHIKPKDTHAGRPDLCFDYNNLAQSCDNSKTCGHHKGNRFIAFEPGPGCNQEIRISTSDAFIRPKDNPDKKRREAVRQTCDILGFNRDTELVADRQKALKNFLVILKSFPTEIDDFLHDKPFRHILRTLI